MPKMDYKKLATKEAKPTTKSARISKDQENWFEEVTKKHNTNASTIILHALEQTYSDFPKS